MTWSSKPCTSTRLNATEAPGPWKRTSTPSGRSRGQTLAGRERTSKAIQRKKAKAAKPKKSDPMGAIALVLVVLSLAGGGGAWWWLNRRKTIATEEESAKPTLVAHSAIGRGRHEGKTVREQPEDELRPGADHRRADGW